MSKNNFKFSILGNPNSGKSAVFNLITGLNQKVSNYPGITVEKHSSIISLENKNISIDDYPGTYSTKSQSIDEAAVRDTVFKWIESKELRPDGIIYVADITNLRRNLYFFSQLLPLNIPIILLLNMSDLINPADILSIQKLKKEFKIFDIISFSALKRQGLKELRKSMVDLLRNKSKSKNTFLSLSSENRKLLKPIIDILKNSIDASKDLIEDLSLSIFSSESFCKSSFFSNSIKDKVLRERKNILSKISTSMSKTINTLESDLRYGFIDEILFNSNFKDRSQIEDKTKSEKLDKFLTHSIFGPFLYIGILYFIFQSIFTFASIPMDFIDGIVSSFGNFVYNNLPDSILRDLIVDGIIAGVGGIVIFLPQIIILMLFMIILEDTGYMTRVTFMSDKYMRMMGLHGKSILPIMSGYACAIPGIISSRTIDSWKERLVTILILPLISCSARLPVYVLMISAFIPQIYIYDFIGLQGFVMVCMYFLGTITAFILAKVFSKFLSEKSNPSFVMEIPPYRLPILKSVLKQLINRSKLFLVNAGKIIMLISIILWFLVSFPKHNGESVSIKDSYAGKVGQLIEPVIKPLGFDWKIGIGLITSFAAREVVVSTLSTIYNVEDDGENMVNLKEAMKNDINPVTGKNVFTPLVAISIMVFYVYAAQCVATFAIVKTETNTWKWPIFMIAYMTLLAYIMSFLVYNLGQYFGFS
ncbi:MAG: ferrous iron transport protein B [Candidatus Marinimicrobia bacterium]|nr:ferrous iron transport protein B [Candidatus Neomarinimicrobiota bacterium]